MSDPRTPRPSFVHAIAVDFDGTLTEGGGPPSAEALAAIAEARAAGRKVVLVTGRILAELRAEHPGLEERFDAVVGENGAVLFTPARGERRLSAPVPAALADALVARGVPVRRGAVLLATEAQHEDAVHEEIRRLGLECQPIRNREALMVLPSGASKGAGLYAALGVLGISHHNAIGFGDAENDHSLLDACELGVAVGNAVDALKARADVVLREPDGEGVARFLRGPVVAGELRLVPERWQVEIGRDADGATVTIPAAQANVLVTGETRSGKSWLAGLIAERLMEADYSVCVIDPEGDHPALGRLRGAVTLGAPDRPPAPEELRRVLQHRFGSAIADLSSLDASERPAFYLAALEQLEAQRRENGLPHWIFLDEAQLPMGRWLAARNGSDLAAKGFCLVTWKPAALDPTVYDEIDVVLITGPLAPKRRGLEWLPARFDRTRASALFGTLRPGEALLLTPNGGGARVFRSGARSVPHVRHWRKYVTERLPLHRAFHFSASGRVAGNLAEFHREVRAANAAALMEHAARHDFSRWIRDVIADETLAAELARVESRWPSDPLAGEALRTAILEAVRARYLEEGGGALPSSA